MWIDAKTIDSTYLFIKEVKYTLSEMYTNQIECPQLKSAAFSLVFQIDFDVSVESTRVEKRSQIL